MPATTDETDAFVVKLVDRFRGTAAAGKTAVANGAAGHADEDAPRKLVRRTPGRDRPGRFGAATDSLRIPESLANVCSQRHRRLRSSCWKSCRPWKR